MNKRDFIESLNKDQKETLLKYWYLFDNIEYRNTSESIRCYLSRIREQESKLRWRIEKLWNILNDVEYAAFNEGLKQAENNKVRGDK